MKQLFSERLAPLLVWSEGHPKEEESHEAGPVRCSGFKSRSDPVPQRGLPWVPGILPPPHLLPCPWLPQDQDLEADWGKQRNPCGKEINGPLGAGLISPPLSPRWRLAIVRVCLCVKGSQIEEMRVRLTNPGEGF